MLRARTLLIAATAATIFALSGCSAPADSSPKPATKPSHSAVAQTAAQACAIMQASMSDASAEVQGVMSTAMTDPAGATQKLEALSTAMESGLDKVSNDKAHAAFQKADDSLTDRGRKQRSG